LLHAAHLPGPYVLVGHSYGGLIVRLYASTSPDEVAGLVLVDGSNEEHDPLLQGSLTPEQFADHARVIYGPLLGPPPAEYEDFELIDLPAGFDQMRQARAETPLRPVPLVVLSRGTQDIPPTCFRRGSLWR
jgi:pimeloyl-ACP methyl ester carboxylesterase